MAGAFIRDGFDNFGSVLRIDDTNACSFYTATMIEAMKQML